jgi:hypothetical protein
VEYGCSTKYTADLIRLISAPTAMPLTHPLPAGLTEEGKRAVELLVALGNANEPFRRGSTGDEPPYQYTGAWMQRLRREAYKVSERSTVQAISIDHWKQMARLADSWLLLAWRIKAGVGVWKASAIAKEQQSVTRRGQRTHQAIPQRFKIERHMKALVETVPQRVNRQLAKLTLTVSTNPSPRITLVSAPPAAVAAWGAALLLDGSAACAPSLLPFSHFFGRCGNQECGAWFFRPGGRGQQRSHCGRKGCEDKIEDQRKRLRRAKSRTT